MLEDGRLEQQASRLSNQQYTMSWICFKQLHDKSIFRYLGMTPDSERSTQLERLARDLLSLQTSETLKIDLERIASPVNGTTTEMLRRDLTHAGVLTQEASFSKRLMGLVEVDRNLDSTPQQNQLPGHLQKLEELFEKTHALPHLQDITEDDIAAEIDAYRFEQ